jgi:hypothetical protein
VPEERLLLETQLDLIEGVVAAIDLSEVSNRCDATTRSKLAAGKKGPQGKQSTINAMFRAEFDDRGWQSEEGLRRPRQRPQFGRGRPRALLESAPIR